MDTFDPRCDILVLRRKTVRWCCIALVSLAPDNRVSGHLNLSAGRTKANQRIFMPKPLHRLTAQLALASARSLMCTTAPTMFIQIVASLSFYLSLYEEISEIWNTSWSNEVPV